MTTQDFKKKNILSIFLSYFGNHKKLFALDTLTYLMSIYQDWVIKLVRLKVILVMFHICTLL